MPYIRLQHEMVQARYDEPTGKWHVRLRRPLAGSHGEFEEFEDTADLLFTGLGGLSRWNWPEIEGLVRFKGTLLHSADWTVSSPTATAADEGQSVMRVGWEESVRDWGDKRVAVIGVVCGVLFVDVGRKGLADTACVVNRARRRSRLYLRCSRVSRSYTTTSAGALGSLFPSRVARWQN